MKNDTPRHPKMYRLASTLDIPRLMAVGTMESLWHWAADFAPQGDIGKFSNQEIAKGIEWNRDPDELIFALLEARWLDPSSNPKVRLLIHDWPQHCENTVHAYLLRHRLTFADGTQPNMASAPTDARAGIQADYAGTTRNPSPENPPWPHLWHEFWDAWPKYRKQNRLPALKAWCKLVTTETLAREIIEGVHIHSQPGGALAKDPQYIPYAVTWLNNRRWQEPYIPTDNATTDETEIFEARNPTDADLAVGAGPDL